MKERAVSLGVGQRAEARRASWARVSARLADYCALTKPGITFYVALTGAAGFYLATPGSLSPGLLVHSLLGLTLATAGAAALNHYLERDVDARMHRTHQRPLAAERLNPRRAVWFAVTLSILGILQLLVFVRPAAALVTAASLVSYVFVYTPLKRRSSICTLVGAVPGALPILAGWVAAGGSASSPAAWALFGILFLWQLPHSLSLAWLFRDDYRRGGLAIVTVSDPEGKSTGRQILFYTLALLPVSLVPSFHGLTGTVYLVGAGLVSSLYLAAAAAMWRQPCARTARRLFLASLVYLPILLALLVVDRAAG